MRLLIDPIVIRVYGDEPTARAINEALDQLEPNYRERVVQVSDLAAITRPGWNRQGCLVVVEANGSSDRICAKKLLEPILGARDLLIIN